MKVSKYFKPLDFIHAGVYVVMLTTFIVTRNLIDTIFLSLVIVNYFPLIYLLRKHGYLKTGDDFGYMPTKRGLAFFYIWTQMPLDVLWEKIRTDRLSLILVRVLLILSVLTLLSYLLLVLAQWL